MSISIRTAFVETLRTPVTLAFIRHHVPNSSVIAPAPVGDGVKLNTLPTSGNTPSIISHNFTNGSDHLGIRFYTAPTGIFRNSPVGLIGSPSESIVMISSENQDGVRLINPIKIPTCDTNTLYFRYHRNTTIPPKLQLRVSNEFFDLPLVFTSNAPTYDIVSSEFSHVIGGETEISIHLNRNGLGVEVFILIGDRVWCRSKSVVNFDLPSSGSVSHHLHSNDQRAEDFLYGLEIREYLPYVWSTAIDENGCYSVPPTLVTTLESGNLTNQELVPPNINATTKLFISNTGIVESTATITLNGGTTLSVKLAPNGSRVIGPLISNGDPISISGNNLSVTTKYLEKIS